MPSVSPEVRGFLLADFEKLMARAFRLASKGLGYTSPNPPVGALLIRDGRIISKGYHHRAGSRHAEIEAIEKAGENAKGATLITTLEPCSHHGKTPPCADAIIAAGISDVVGATIDKNPAVSGTGYGKLRSAGISVTDGVYEAYAREFYRPYFKYITTGLPFVTLKFAQSVDGRIATKGGHSRWISSPESLKLSHSLRAVNNAVLIGRVTLQRDNPKLTTRLVRGKNPVRIVLSATGRITRKKEIFTDEAAPTYIAVPRGANLKENDGYKIIRVRKSEDRFDLKDLLIKLGKIQITTLLVEGGSRVLTSFLEQKLADKVVACIAPLLIGNGIPAIRELGIRSIGEAIRFEDINWLKSGPDMIFSGRPVWN